MSGKSGRKNVSKQKRSAESMKETPSKKRKKVSQMIVDWPK
jgi:hypothetical protein